MLPGNLQSQYTDLYFTTATVKNWRHLLTPDKYKKIITDSLAFLSEESIVRVYAFVIMPNHFHLIWQMIGDKTFSNTRLRFMKFVAQRIKSDLSFNHPEVLEIFKVDRNDRKYQFFKDKPLSIPLFTDEVVLQKMKYIHRNPIQPRWSLVNKVEEYGWSSAAFYSKADLRWTFLKHFWYGDDWPPPDDCY
ncbi:MAG: hypothetical protein KDC86_02960 [Saprospiraceae bacterium]|nr:hypothetical protein [Saprospiraceae bacterium]